MGKIPFLAAAALVAAGCTTTPEWVHPEKDEAARQAALKTCEERADAAFSVDESEALGHGDFGAYGELADERRAMIESCMTGQGWSRYAGPGGEAPSTPAETVPAETTPAEYRGAPVAAPEAVAAPATPSVPRPEAVASPRPAATSGPGPAPVPAAPAGNNAPRPAAAPVPGPQPTVPPPAPRVTGGPDPSPPAPPTSAAGSGPAQAKSGSQRSAERKACEDKAENALSEASGAALAHGDMTTYDELETRKETMIRECLVALGWSAADLD